MIKYKVYLINGREGIPLKDIQKLSVKQVFEYFYYLSQFSFSDKLENLSENEIFEKTRIYTGDKDNHGDNYKFHIVECDNNDMALYDNKFYGDKLYYITDSRDICHLELVISISG